MVINQFVKFVLIKKVEKMNEDERIKIFWLETCGTGNTMTLSQFVHHVNSMEEE